MCTDVSLQPSPTPSLLCPMPQRNGTPMDYIIFTLSLDGLYWCHDWRPGGNRGPAGPIRPSCFGTASVRQGLHPSWSVVPPGGPSCKAPGRPGLGAHTATCFLLSGGKACSAAHIWVSQLPFICSQSCHPSEKTPPH